MAYSLKQELSKQERFMGGHRALCGLRRRDYLSCYDARSGSGR